MDTVRQTLGLGLEIVNREQYWKDSELFRVNARTCISASDAKEAFYRTMTAANSIAQRWVINGPHDAGMWEFAGSADKPSIRIPGVELIDFRSDSTIEVSPAKLAS